MKRLLFVTAFFALTVVSMEAQTLRFKNGRVLDLSAVRVTGGHVRIPADPSNPSAGEISFPVSDLERVDWPTPKELSASSDALKAGKLGEALKQNDAILPRLEPFRDVPGTWWPRAMLLRAEILARLGRVPEAEVACEMLRQSALGAPLADQARVAVLDSLAASSTNRDTVRERLDAFAASSPKEKIILARIDLIRARLLQADGNVEDALLTYLRVPVLYPAQTDPAPAALLGAAACLRALGENIRAETTMRDLIERFPESAEAGQARSLLSSP